MDDAWWYKHHPFITGEDGEPMRAPAARLVLGASHQLADAASVSLLNSLSTLSALGGTIAGQATSIEEPAGDPRKFYRLILP